MPGRLAFRPAARLRLHRLPAPAQLGAGRGGWCGAESADAQHNQQHIKQEQGFRLLFPVLFLVLFFLQEERAPRGGLARGPAVLAWQKL